MKETNELILFIVKIERREREREREKVCIYSAIIIINYWFLFDRERLVVCVERVCKVWPRPWLWH